MSPLPRPLGPPRHNHMTRDIKRRNVCPACDLHHTRQAPQPEVDIPVWCICAPDFWRRGLQDPACRHDELEELYEEIDRLNELVRDIEMN